VIEKYIGSLSEYEAWSLPVRTEPEGDVLLPSLFCKKQVRVRWFFDGSRQCILWQSQYKLPLFGIFLKGPGFRESRSFEKKATAFHQSLANTIPWIPEKPRLIDFAVNIFRTLHGYYPFYLHVPSTKYLDMDAEVVAGETSKAKQTIDEAQVYLDESGEILLPRREDIAAFLISRERLKLTPVLYYGNFLYLTHTPKEDKLLTEVKAELLARPVSDGDDALLGEVVLRLVHLTAAVKDHFSKHAV